MTEAEVLSETTVQPTGDLRLDMKPVGSTTGFVDGAWWPYSTELATEVPALLAAITGRLGSIERVSYNLAGWASASRRVDAGGIRVRLDGFRTRPPDTIDVSGVNDHRVTLLVIPPTTDQAAARDIMRRASTDGNTDSTDTLLGNG
ncbi:MAG TPA: DUF5994 family protein [Nakamurella sp.]